MGHIVLLGDSIFDNARYVPDRPPVIEQVRQSLPKEWTATLLAVDGHVTQDVIGQTKGIFPEVTHLVVSVGGNDALGESGVIYQKVGTVAEGLGLLQEVHSRFRDDYCKMLQGVLALKKPTVICTIYDSIPGLQTAELTALSLFNEVILRAAFQAGVPVIDLRLLCDQPGDYSHLSPIEPSVVGGAKIARVIAEVAAKHDFGQGRSSVYW
jgi:hypothetical protein